MLTEEHLGLLQDAPALRVAKLCRQAAPQPGPKPAGKARKKKKGKKGSAQGSVPATSSTASSNALAAVNNPRVLVLGKNSVVVEWL